MGSIGIGDRVNGLDQAYLNRIFYRLLLWQENRRLLKRLDRSTRFAVSGGVNCVAVPEEIFANLAYVESAYATLLIRELFQVFARQVGKGKLRETSDYDD